MYLSDQDIFILAQIFGILGFFAAVIRLQFKSKRAMMLGCIPMYVFFGLQFYMFEAWVALFLVSFGILRIVALSVNLSKAKRQIFVAAYLSVTLVVSLWMAEALIALIIMPSPFVVTVAELQKCAVRYRVFFMISHMQWLIFHTAIGSVGGVLTEIGNLASNISGLVRHHGLSVAMPGLQRAPAYSPVKKRI